MSTDVPFVHKLDTLCPRCGKRWGEHDPRHEIGFHCAEVRAPGLHYPTALDVLRLAVEAHLDVATSMKHNVADWCESVGPLAEALDEVRAGLGMTPYDHENEDG